MQAAIEERISHLEQVMKEAKIVSNTKKGDVVGLGSEVTIQKAIKQSGILAHFPEIDLTTNKVGIFGELKRLEDKVKTGDRVEIYRPLKQDPKDRRFAQLASTR